MMNQQTYIPRQCEIAKDALIQRRSNSIVIKSKTVQMKSLKFKPLTQERLRELLLYCQETGGFTWRVSKAHKIHVGAVAGTFDSLGYKCIQIDGFLYKAHRLAFLYMTGGWPYKHVDHIDRNPGNNAWCNLREATRSQNLANAGVSKNNKCGLKGVSWIMRGGRWQARICVQRRKLYLGCFDTPEKASTAYAEAAAKYFSDFARTD